MDSKMEDPCSICYMKIDEASGNCTLPCKHTFHVQCFVKWSAKNPSCPLCRKEVEGIAADTESEAEYVPGIPNTTFRHVTRLMSMVNLGEICVPEDDITFVMDQCNVTRGEACNMLRDTDGDVMDAIIALRHSTRDGPVHGPVNFDVVTDERRAFWGVQALFDPQPVKETQRYLRWRSARGSTRGGPHSSVHWKHLENEFILDVDGYDTD